MCSRRCGAGRPPSARSSVPTTKLRVWPSLVRSVNVVTLETFGPSAATTRPVALMTLDAGAVVAAADGEGGEVDCGAHRTIARAMTARATRAKRVTTEARTTPLDPAPTPRSGVAR